MTNHQETIRPGLEGVVAAETTLSSVDGEAGELIIAGYPVEELAPNATFEETAWLLWNGELPCDEDLEAFAGMLASHRAIPAATLALLREAAANGIPAMDTLRMAAGTLDLDGAAGASTPAAQPAVQPAVQAAMLAARFPSIVAAYWRLLRGEEPVAPRGDLGHAANYLWMLRATEPGAAETRALETYLNTVVDHGLNASTFTARVIISTGSDLVSAVTGAVGALKGPLHGGAPGPALDMVLEIGSEERAESYIRAKLERGERLMGFGHRVYKVRDPRADVLAAAADALFRNGGDRDLYRLATKVEQTALALLEEQKPGRRLQTNVEFYTALLLHGIGLPNDLFTPTFAVSRVVGWIAHAFEQERAGRLIRPQSVYAGPRGRRWAGA
ncbi:MAG TPA: citrate synthase/methylcitrate synthase [Candidatus Kapabacteria bacterium]|nr:citrate synthase/methylcitrate synthase [Candidatus Kapabacteria bacterium]